MAIDSTSGQPNESDREPGDVPEDVDVTPVADEAAEAGDVEAPESGDVPAEVEGDVEAVDESEPEAEAVEPEIADAEPDDEPAFEEPEAGESEAEAGLADALFDLNEDGTEDEVHQPVRKLTKAPVKKAQPARKRTATTAPTTTGPTTPWAFVRQAIGELRKVVWPSGEMVGQYFIVVLVFVLFIMTLVAGLDYLFGLGLIQIFR